MSVIDYSWDFSKEEFSLDLDFFNEKEQEDKLWQARTGLNHETLCGAIETIIFMSDKPIQLLKIKNQIDSDLPLRVVHDAISRLQSEYEQKHHGIRLMEVAQGYQFRTKATYSKVVQNMFKVQSLQLSPTALEVLAIIAYKQPISKNTVESIRGVDSSHIVRALMDRRLVRIVGRSEEVGRPSLYGTSAEFLEVFNLNEITDLPSEIELEELASANEIGQISDIKTIVQAGDKKRFDTDELLELDKISDSIKEISSDTMFTKSLKSMDKVRKSDEGVEKKSAFDILEEYVNKAQVIEQNKNSSTSEILTTVMSPKAITLADLHTALFNTPELEDEDYEDTEVELELESGELVDIKLSSEEKEDFDQEFEDRKQVNEIEETADSILEKSQALLDSLNSDEIEIVEAQTNSLMGDSLEADIDEAFNNLMGDSQEEEPLEVAKIEDKVPAEINFDDLDISSFISQKLATAQVEEEDKEQGIKEDSSEEVELSNALDEAFANLTGESLGDEESVALEDEEVVENIDISHVQFNEETDTNKIDQ